MPQLTRLLPSTPSITWLFATKTYANRFSILQLLKSRRAHFGFGSLAALAFVQIGLFRQENWSIHGIHLHKRCQGDFLSLRSHKSFIFVPFLLKSSWKYINLNLGPKKRRESYLSKWVN